MLCCVHCFVLWLLHADTFLKMGAPGSLERVTIVPFGQQTLDAVVQGFNRFDVAQARCYLESDRQRLLGIIEAGFGTFDAFNRTMRSLLIARFDASPMLVDNVTAGAVA